MREMESEWFSLRTTKQQSYHSCFFIRGMQNKTKSMVRCYHFLMNIFLGVSLLLGEVVSTPTRVSVSWTAELSEPLAETSERLVSFNFDWHPANEGPTWGENASLLTIDLKNERLKALASAMSPAVLRLGGSEGDDAVYDVDGKWCQRSRGGSGVPDKAYCLTMKRWEEILDFASQTEVDVEFGVNVMYGRNCTKRCEPQPCAAGNTGYGTCSAWDPSNAIALLNYTAARKLRLYAVAVGNEKEHVLTPEDYASCMKIMRDQIDHLWPDESTRPLLVGPDMNPRADWLKEMLQAGGNSADAVTFHLYPGYGLDPSLKQEIMEPGFLDFTRKMSSIMKNVVANASPKSELWIGETAAAWHSGERNITDSFISSFWFLDQRMDTCLFRLLYHYHCF